MVFTETNGTKIPSFRTLLSDRVEVDGLFDRNLRTFAEFPVTNILEDINKYVLILAVPGLSKDVFKIKLEK